MTNGLHATLQLAECDGHQSISITSCFCGPINGPTVLCTDFLDVSTRHKSRADVQNKPGSIASGMVSTSRLPETVIRSS
jgi:hypothetical protein